MTNFFIDRFLGKKILSFACDGSNYLILFNNGARIVVYSRMNVKFINPRDVIVTNIDVFQGKIKFSFGESVLEIYIDDNLVESVVMEVDGQTIVS